MSLGSRITREARKKPNDSRLNSEDERNGSFPSLRKRSCSSGPTRNNNASMRELLR